MATGLYVARDHTSCLHLAFPLDLYGQAKLALEVVFEMLVRVDATM